MNTVNFIMIGGSGHICELNHYPAILSLKKDGIDARVAAICDPQNPRGMQGEHYKVGRDNLSTILSSDDPIWINPSDFDNPADLKERLDTVAKENDINIAVIATDPTFHYFYSDWAVSAGINVLCDKPLVAVPNSSWMPDQAALIEQRFESLYKKVVKAQELNPNYRFSTPLRRRALSPFITIADNLNDVYKRTGEGLKYVTAVINSGVHRYPIEFLKGGAHGYIEGVGSLSHSSYHYLDVIAWYLQCAPGSATKIRLTLPYVFRVKDYLSKYGYEELMRLNQEDPSIVSENVNLPKQVLNAELDFVVHMHLYDDDDHKVGLVSYTSDHTTFTTRTTKYDPDMLDHTNDENGGRMSQIYFDIHQGALQNWQLVKNDVVFEPNIINSTQRLHPALGKSHLHTTYTDAYDSETVTLKDLFISFAKKTAGIPVPEKHDEHLQILSTQKLTHRIFSATYELIASDYANPGEHKEIIIDMRNYI